MTEISAGASESLIDCNMPVVGSRMLYRDHLYRSIQNGAVPSATN